VVAVKRSAAIRIRGKKWHGLKASFAGALIPAFLPEMVEQDKPDATVHVLPADLISPLLPPQLTSLFLPSPYRLHKSQGRDGSALLEAEANSLLLLLFSSSSSFIPRRKMTSSHTLLMYPRWYANLKKTDSKIHVVKGPYEWYHGSVKRLHT
jgi:hypothetical protein